MKIKCDGIYKTIDSKDFGIFQKSGWEKVIAEPIIEPEPIKEEVKVEEPIVEEVVEKEPGPIEEEIMPKAKKKKKA